jgi:nucleoside-diphosphate-sugar epimerase
MELDLSFFNNKRILITGGGGYLGSKLAEVLAKTSAVVFLLDTCFNETAESLLIKRSNVSRLEGNLLNQEELDRLVSISKPDLIFHFAAILNRERDFSEYNILYNVNVQGTLHLLESLKNQNYIGFYFSSSSEVYGNANLSPFREDQYPSPASPYSLTKLMAEHLISTYSQIYNKPYTILRLFNFHGPKMPKSFFLSHLEHALLNDLPFEMTEGQQKRDFLHVDDLVLLVLQVAMRAQSNGQIINICSGQGVSIRSLAEKIAEKMQKQHLLRIGVLPYRTNEIWEMFGDNTKLKLFLK